LNRGGGSTHVSPEARPQLRLVAGDGPLEDSCLPAHTEPDRDGAHVLVVGTDACARASVREDLRTVLPAGTAFGEAGETWEVLASAANSRMVVLIDDLRDVSVESLARLLGRRHPTLPILAVGEQTRATSIENVPADGAAL